MHPHPVDEHLYYFSYFPIKNNASVKKKNLNEHYEFHQYYFTGFDIAQLYSFIR